MLTDHVELFFFLNVRKLFEGLKTTVIFVVSALIVALSLTTVESHHFVSEKE